jgi:hypothetical protein
MLEAVSEAIYKWKLKNNSDCLYSDLYISKFGDEFHHIDYLMVIDSSIVLVKYYNYIGNIYGAENISEWTQTIGHSGFKFNNPLRELRELANQIKDSIGDFDVDFYVIFSDKSHFPKQMPESVIKKATLLETLKSMDRVRQPRNCENIRQQLEVIFKS